MSPAACVAELDEPIDLRKILPGDLGSLPAVRFKNLEISYGELEARAAQLARRLVGLGVTPTDRVAIYLERSLHVPIALRAVLMTGAAYVPLDPAYPGDRLAFMLRDSEPRVLLTQRSLERRFPVSASIPLLLDGQDEDERPGVPLPDESRQEGPAYVIYTSGSTGVPKGIPLGRRALANLIDWQCRDSAADSSWRTLQFTPLSFDVHYQEFFSTWATCGTLVLIDEETRLDPSALLATIEQERIARIFMPLLVPRNVAVVFPSRIADGEQLRITPTLRRFFIELKECSLRNHYGPSETHVVTAYTLPADPATWPVLPSIGTPLPGVKLTVVDEHGNLASSQTAGELHIGGLPLGEGYFRRPELTADRFVTVGGARFYRTGDQVRRRADGNYEFLGRLDDQVKIRGNRVELGEIEVRLLEHPFVANCAVALHGSRGVDQRLVGYWTARPGTATTARELRQFLSDRLPSYMVPSEFVCLPSLPLSPSGKLDRRALPAPSGARSNWDGKYHAPRDSLEPQLFSDDLGRLARRPVRRRHRQLLRIRRRFDPRRPAHGAHRIGVGARPGDGRPVSRSDDRTDRRPDPQAPVRRPRVVSDLRSISRREATLLLRAGSSLRRDAMLFGDAVGDVNKLSAAGDQPFYALRLSRRNEKGDEPISQPFTYAAKLLRDIGAHATERPVFPPAGPHAATSPTRWPGNSKPRGNRSACSRSSTPLCPATRADIIPGENDCVGASNASRRSASGNDSRTEPAWFRNGPIRTGRPVAARRNSWAAIERRYFASQKTYSGPTISFAASETIDCGVDVCRDVADARLGWESLVEGKLCAHRIAGHHFSIIYDDQGVAELGELLRAELSQVDRPSRRSSPAESADRSHCPWGATGRCRVRRRASMRGRWSRRSSLCARPTAFWAQTSRMPCFLRSASCFSVGPFQRPT